MHFDDFDSVGPAAGNSRAACVHGAPIAISSSHTPMVYVPDETVMRGFRRPATHHSPRGRVYPAQRMQSSGGNRSSPWPGGVLGCDLGVCGLAVGCTAYM